MIPSDKPTGLVISLCDVSGNMVRPWAEAGYECYCVDVNNPIREPRIEPAKCGGFINYVWGDIRSWYPPSNRKIEIVFAFPPCTDMTCSDARDFKIKRGYRLSDALELFDACQLVGEWSRAPYMIENPMGRFNTHRRDPDFIFHPYEYAGYLAAYADEAYTKRTCLWTGNGFIHPPKRPIKVTLDSLIRDMSKSDDRAYLRAVTPKGFALATYFANSLLKEGTKV